MKHWPINQLYSAQQTHRLGENREQTGIFKTPVTTADIDSNGIIGDIQADRRVHGGPEKALHQYAIASYQRCQQAFPALAEHLVAGSMGENISAAGMDESNVCIGDIFQVGNVTVQVSQPRRPCWKINSKFEEPQLAKFIEQSFINGWYYRVLKSGTLHHDETMTLVERPNNISVQQFLQICAEHRPDLHDLAAALQCQGLNANWRQKLQQRLDYLQKA